MVPIFARSITEPHLARLGLLSNCAIVLSEKMSTTQTVRVSSKHQIAIPAAARRELGIHAGDELIVDVRAGSHLVIMPRPRTPDEWARRLSELNAQAWAGADPVAHIQEERDAWTEHRDSSRP